MRVFIAAEPPRDVREQLAGWLRAASVGTEYRAVSPPNMHLTLCFLGARDTAEVDAAEATMREAASPTGGLRTGAPVWLPRRSPRVLAVDIHDPEAGLAALQGDLSESLGRAIGYEEPRRFRPHITLARFGRAARPRRELPATPDLRFYPESLALYRSLLSPAGAEYEQLAAVPLC